MDIIGLSLNLQTEFEWTNGYGSSKALSSYLNQYLKLEDKYNKSYPIRTEHRTGYPAGRYWSTVFSWMAGDFTFTGNIIFMCIITLFYLKLYCNISVFNDFFSLLLFIRISEFYLFIPATNYIMQTRWNFITTICIFGLWLISRFKIKNNTIYYVR